MVSQFFSDIAMSHAEGALGSENEQMKALVCVCVRNPVYGLSGMYECVIIM